MISFIGKNSTAGYWLAFHAALGAVSILSPYGLIAWFYLVLFSSLPHVVTGTRSSRRIHLACLIAYLSAFELLARMAQTSPIIPYELSKYLMFVLLLLGIFGGSAKGRRGFWMLLLLLPAIAVDESGLVDDYRYYVFNLLGTVNVALAIVFFTRLPVAEEQLRSLLRLVLYPLVSVLAFTYLSTPDYDEIEFSLGASFDTAGGFGSNQVSTVLGLGMFLVFVFWLNRWKLSGWRSMDALLLFAFAFQGLLTFSRGGMLGGALGILIVLYYIYRAGSHQLRRLRLPALRRYAIPALFLSVGAFFAADRLTGGLLSLRYQGETRGTLSGSKQKNLNTLTTGRYDIFLGDIELWGQYPVLGAGVGTSKYLRNKLRGVIAHVELGRLLAEHGVLGLIYFLVLCGAAFDIWRTTSNPMLKGILMALFIISLYTTFHAAMRTFVTPLLTGLSLIAVVTKPHKENRILPNENHTLYR